MKNLLFLLFALGLPVVVVGQDTPPIGLPPLPFTIPPPPPDPSDTILVKDVQVSFVGTPLLTSEEVLSQLQIETGKPISDRDLRAKYSFLIESGKVDFMNVDPIVEPDGVVLRVEVGFPMDVGRIELTGIDDSLLAEFWPRLSIKIGEKVDFLGRKREVGIVQSFLNSKGYPDAEVSLTTEPISQDGTYALKFGVTMGPRIWVRRIHLKGNRAFSSRGLMPLIDQQENAPRLPRAAFESAFERLKEFYAEANGFISVRLELPALRETGEKGVFDLFLEVTEGPRYTLDDIAFSGMGRLVASELAELINLHRGDPYSLTVLEKAKSAIEAAYKQIGYLDANVEVRWTQSGENQVSITFVVSEGAEFRYGAISIEGNTRTRDMVIRRELQFAPGDLINMDAFDRSKKAIEDLDYFESVDFHWEDSQETGVKDLFINIWEKPTGDVNFHTSYSSISGFHLVLSLDQSDFDPFNYPEFAGAGVRFAMDMDFSGSGGHLGLSFGRRDFLGRSLQLELPEASAQTDTVKAGLPGAEGLEVKATSMRENQKP